MKIYNLNLWGFKDFKPKAVAFAFIRFDPPLSAFY